MVMFVCMFVSMFALNASAELKKIGTAQYNAGTYGLVLDTDTGLVWFDYTKEPSGWGSWSAMMDWASNLNPAITLDNGYTVTWNGTWRLPSYGTSREDSEMGHLYFESLGNEYYYGRSGNHDYIDLPMNQYPFEGVKHSSGPFVNLKVVWYFTSTPAGNGWYYFNMGGGNSGVYVTSPRTYGLAVRSTSSVKFNGTEVCTTNTTTNTTGNCDCNNGNNGGYNNTGTNNNGGTNNTGETPIGSDYSFKVSNMTYGNMKLWIKFKHYGNSPDGQMLWTIDNYGYNQ